MKTKTLAAFVFSMLFMATSSLVVQGQTQTEYTIQINDDGSANWSIRQTGTDMQVTPEIYDAFIQKVSSLVGEAENITNRDMICENFKMTANVSTSYTTVRYQFDWRNFSKAETSRIVVGDAFATEDFFLLLYGDGSVYVTYPSEYAVESVSPTPSERDFQRYMLRWYLTLGFQKGEPSVTLKKISAPLDIPKLFLENLPLVGGTAATIIGLLASLFWMRRFKKTKQIVSKEKTGSEILVGVEDEDMIENLLKSAGGSLYQTAIADKCKFSKAKTSQLLAMMEKNGTIKRQKKGRDKIVTLVEPT